MDQSELLTDCETLLTDLAGIGIESLDNEEYEKAKGITIASLLLQELVSFHRMRDSNKKQS